MFENKISMAGVFAAAGSVPGSTEFDQLKWENLSPEQTAEKLIGFTVTGAEPPVGPDGALVLYGYYRDHDRLFAVSIAPADEDADDGMMYSFAALPRKERSK